MHLPSNISEFVHYKRYRRLQVLYFVTAAHVVMMVMMTMTIVIKLFFQRKKYNSNLGR